MVTICYADCAADRPLCDAPGERTPPDRPERIHAALDIIEHAYVMKQRPRGYVTAQRRKLPENGRIQICCFFLGNAKLFPVSRYSLVLVKEW